MSDLAPIIEQSRELSVQARGEQYSAGIFTVPWLARAGLQISPWWSISRDKELRAFWKKVDHLSGAIYTLEARMTAIPFRVIARDPSIHEHVVQAESLSRILMQTPQFGEGWVSFFSRWLEDYLTQDNGAFAEIIGLGDKSGPIIGAPLTIAHLDSSRCQRTGDDEYPIIYTDIDGKRYKLHYSRVLFAAQMASPIREMFGVGLCSVSRCINVAQTLYDILTFKQEKLGSRPHRAILITKGGLDPKDVQSAFQLAESAMDSQGLSRYSKVVVAGAASLGDAGIDQIELSGLPEGFDEQTSITLGMATIALAFGVDARELFPAMQAGATRADALLQHLKQRGKGPGQIIQTVEMSFDQKYLPAHLQMVFDFQDDAQDRQAAEIKKVRADSRLQDKNTGALTTRVMREQMFEVGDLNRSQFERLELMDGRLSDGTSVITLFFSEDSYFRTVLNIGSDDPLDLIGNDPEAVMTTISEKLSELSKEMANTRDPIKKRKIFQAMMAFVYLKKYYENPETLIELLMGADVSPIQPNIQEQGQEQDAGPDKIENRVRRIDTTQPNTRTETSVDRRPGTPQKVEQQTESKE